MEYTVLARRFRPQAFAEVVGQEMVAQALKNAIAAERVAHAYLFTGARGVGKTSMARILAKSLNCPNVVHGDPCNQCEVCDRISAGNDVDVLEIDGASNRGIEDIRTLRSNVNIRSMRSRYKVYIIDEVHMLTREAFNALLKTLEEPPPNVKFVFCTTEPQKLPDTILSRCQRFDFGTIATQSITNRLTQIAAAEGVHVDPDAVELVARRAAGSMRDSQSLFDQLLAFGGASITAVDVHRLLGTASDERLIDLTHSLIERRRDQVLDQFHQALEAGVQLSEFTDQLLSYFRDLMILAAGAREGSLLSVSEDRREILQKQASQWGLQTTVAAMQLLAEAKGRMRGVSYGRVLAEMALVRISLLEDLDGLSTLIGQLKSGKLTIPAGAALPPSNSGASSRGATGSGAGNAASASRADSSSDANRGRPSDPPRDSAASRPGNSRATSAKSADSGPAATPATDSSEPADEPPAGSAANSGPPGGAAAPSVEPPIQVPFEAGRETEFWAQVVSRYNDLTRSHAKNVSSVAISGPKTLVLTFPRSYHFSKQHFERTDHQLRLEKVVAETAGFPVKIELRVDESAAVAAPVAAAAPPTRLADANLVRDVENDPLVREVQTAFDAKIVRTETMTGAAGREGTRDV